MSYISDYGNSVANIYQNLGDAQARARLQQGQGWANALGQIGQSVAAIPGQLQQQKAQDLQQKLSTAQLADIKAQTDERTRATQRAKDYADALKTLIPQYSKQTTDGSIETDDQAISTGLAKSGFAPEAQKWISESASTREKFANLRKLNDEHTQFTKVNQDKQSDLLADIARGVKSPTEFVTAVAHGVTHGSIDMKTAQAFVDQATSAPDAWQQLRDNIINQAPSTRQEQAARRAELAKPFDLSEGQSRYITEPDGKVTTIAAGAAKPKDEWQTFQDTYAKSHGAPSFDKLPVSVQTKAFADFAETKRDPANLQPVQIQGPNGFPIWVKEADAIGKPAAQAPRAVTGAERQALSFYNRGRDAVATLEAPDASGKTLEDRMAHLGTIDQQRLGYEGVGSNYAKSPEMQQYRQAQRAFTEARLRKESGAAIPTEEFANDAVTYFVQPGDDPKTVEQKREKRAKLLEGLGYSAGKAYDEFYGEPLKKIDAVSTKDKIVVTDKHVSMADLELIAKNRGTTVEQEKQRATAAGYVIR